jgi:hypothetical protein
MTVPYNHLLWPAGQKPQTVRDLRRGQLTYLVEAGLGDGQLARQLLIELDPSWEPGPTRVVAQVRVKPTKPKQPKGR